jgi:hypothetical protein
MDKWLLVVIFFITNSPPFHLPTLATPPHQASCFLLWAPTTSKDHATTSISPPPSSFLLSSTSFSPTPPPFQHDFCPSQVPSPPRYLRLARPPLSPRPALTTPTPPQAPPRHLHFFLRSLPSSGATRPYLRAWRVVGTRRPSTSFPAGALRKRWCGLCSCGGGGCDYLLSTRAQCVGI